MAEMAERRASPGAPGQGLAKRRACAKCARLKMRCLWPTDDKEEEPEACIRCARMGLRCSVPASVPRKKRAPSTRVAQLEQRIDGILSLLSTQQQQNGTSISPSPLTPESTVQTSSHASHTSTRSNPIHNAPRSIPVPLPNDTILELLPNFSLTYLQASSYLDRYRQLQMPRYPFVIIPPEANVATLLGNSKCLFWTIMAATAPLTAEVQADFKHWFRQHLATEIIVKQKKRLELLQAILVYLAWGDFQFYVDVPTTSILQLANSLVVDLKLDKAPGDTFLASQSLSLLADAWKALEMRVPQDSSHTSHEMRAVLGYFHVSSPSASLFRRGPRLPWTPYLDRCCAALEKAREYETDLYVVAMAKLHQTADHINNIFTTESITGESPRYLRTTEFMAIERIEAEMKAIVDRFMAMTGTTEAQNPAIMNHYNTLIMRLYEPLIALSPTPLSQSATPSLSPFHRTTGLTRCLTALSSYFTTQLSIPATLLEAQPFTGIGLAAFAIVTACRLLLLESTPDWNPALARSRWDFAAALAGMGDQVEEADRRARESGHWQRLLEDGQGSARRYCFKVRWIRQWYLAKLPEEERAGMEVGGNGGLTGDVQPSTVQFGDMPLYESLWDGFLMSMDPNLLSIAMAAGPNAAEM